MKLTGWWLLRQKLRLDLAAHLHGSELLREGLRRAQGRREGHARQRELEGRDAGYGYQVRADGRPERYCVCDPGDGYVYGLGGES